MSQAPPRNRRSRARRGEGQRLRAEILAAASALLAEAGDPDQMSMRALAEAVGVTPPSIYRHFADKEALLGAVLEERWADVNQVLARAVAGVDDPFAALRQFGLAYLRYAEDNPGHYRVLFSAAAPAGVSTVRAEHPGGPSFSLLMECVQRCIDAGAAVSPGRDAWLLALQIFIAGHGFVDLRIGQRFPFPWPRADQLLDAVLTDLGLAGRARP